MPSITDAIFVLLLFAMTCGVLAPRLLGDADLGWHIRNGELILRTHTITRSDPFSFTMQGRAWYSWEWLYDAGIAAVHKWAGLNGVVFVTAVVIAFTFALLFRLTLIRGGNPLITLLLLLLAFGASAIHLFARPHILSWLFTILWFQILDSAEPINSSRQYERLYWLPLIMLFWANVHGEFLLGFVLLGIYFVSGLVHFLFQLQEREENRIWLQRLGMVTVFSFFSTFINPFGYKLHLHIYEYLNNRWLMDHIDEFQSPNFHGLAQQCFVLLLLIAVAAFTIARRRVRLSQLLVVLFAVQTGFYASRNLPTSCMLLVLIVAPLFSIASSSDSEGPSFPNLFPKFLSRCRSFTQRMSVMESHLRWHIWSLVAFILGLWICAHGGRLGSTQLMSAHFDPAHFPVEAANLIAKEHIAAPMFTPDAWGGFLIYRLSPQTKVFVDDRHDLYGADFFKDHLNVIRVAPNWEKVLDEKQLRWVLVPSESSLANILKLSTQWKLVHEDHTAVLFERS